MSRMSRDRNAKIFVGNLSSRTEERDLDDLFYRYGKIRYVDVISGKGFGFVTFYDERDAEDAIRGEDRREFMGRQIRVEMSTGSGPRRDRGGGRGGGGGAKRNPWRVVVSGLGSRTSWQDLKDFARKAGEVAYTNVERNGTGLIEFTNEKDMRYALKELDDTKLDGQYVRLDEENKSGGGGRGGGRDSRDRSRSPKRDRERRDRSRSRDRGRDRDAGDGKRDRSRSRDRDGERDDQPGDEKAPANPSEDAPEQPSEPAAESNADQAEADQAEGDAKDEDAGQGDNDRAE